MAHPTRDGEVWSDGAQDVVLIAQNVVAFRISAALLSHASSAFADMLNVALPHPIGDIWDGLPVLHLDDHPTELRSFLRVLPDEALAGLQHQRAHRYDQGASPTSPIIPFATIASIILIANKYCANNVLAAASSRLPGLFTFPSKEFTLGRFQQKAKSRHGIDFQLTDALAAVDVARQLRQSPDDMLLMSLYLCCICDPIILRNGVTRKDGSIRAKLSDDDFRRCLKIRTHLDREWHGINSRVLDPAQYWIFLECCRRGQYCPGIVSEMRTAFLAEYEKPDMSCVFVGGKSKAYQTHCRRLCRTCAGRLSYQYVKQYKAVYSKLRQYIGLAAQPDDSNNGERVVHEGSGTSGPRRRNAST